MLCCCVAQPELLGAANGQGPPTMETVVLREWDGPQGRMQECQVDPPHGLRFKRKVSVLCRGVMQSAVVRSFTVLLQAEQHLLSRVLQLWPDDGSCFTCHAR